MADFKRACVQRLAYRNTDVHAKLFDEVFAIMPNDASKLFWYEFVAAHGKSDYDRFEAEYIAKFKWTFEAKRFERLMGDELTLAQKINGAKKLFGTKDSAVALKIMRLCVPALKPSLTKQITDALNSLKLDG